MILRGELTRFLGEVVGTMLLLLLGDGVVANVVLKKTKGGSGGWIVITFGWAMAVFVGVYCVASMSGAQLNPAVTIGLALAGKFPWSEVPLYILGQTVGAALGALLVWVQYRQHFDVTEDRDLKLVVFCTVPAIRSFMDNFLSEVIGTFVLVFGVLCLAAPNVGIGSIDALPVSLLVLAIGLSLGGTTGYAINPARDLGPRIMHSVLPIRDKRNSDWGYSWIPVVAPICGAAIAAATYRLMF